MNLDKVLIIVGMLATITISCNKEKEDPFQSNALITGPDVRDCICCGGYFIEINDSTYNFNTLPSSSGIDLAAETFPLNVKLDWDYDLKCGDIQYIDISHIVKE